MLTSKANRPKETLLQRLRHTSREPMFRAQGGVPHTIHVHIVMVFDPTLIPNDLAQIYIYIIYIKRRIAFWFHLTAPYQIMFKVRGSAELELRGDFLPLGFLAVKPDEEEEQVEDMSSLDAAAR